MASLTGVSLKNVRVFAGEVPHSFDLKPLTIFAGTNSSGKSTILKTLSLIRQSQGIGESNEGNHARLRFKGSLVDVGNFRTLRSDSGADKPVEIGFTIEGAQNLGWRRWLNACFERKGLAPYEAVAEDDKLVRHVVTTHLIFDAGSNDRSALLREGRLTIDHADVTYNVNYARVVSPQGGLGENLFTVTMPAPMAYAGSQIPGARASEDGTKFTFLCQVRGLLPAVLFTQPDGPEQKNAPWVNGPMPPFLQVSLEATKSALRGIHYIGPLRSSPKRYYQVDWDSSHSLDPVGDFLPFVLREGSKRVTNCEPRSSMAVVEPLTLALNRWLAYLRTGHISDYRNAAHEYSIKASDSDAFLEVNLRSGVTGRGHPLVDSGFGMSQVFPVLARCLLADPEDLILIEQPELHLHPALQVRIADFFAAMTLVGKRVCVETHSEHLVNAVRAIIAEQPTSQLAAKTCIYFLQATDGAVHVHNMALNADGSLSEWPREFFGEALELTARILKAKRSRNQTGRR